MIKATCFLVDPKKQIKKFWGSSSKKQTPFVPPTPTFDFNKNAEQQKAIQQAQQEKNLREYARKSITKKI